MRSRLSRLLVIPLLAASLLGTGLTLTANVQDAAAVSCGSSAAEKVRWEYWAAWKPSLGPALWADYTMKVSNACWTSSTVYCGSISYAKVAGNKAVDGAAWGCQRNANGSARHWITWTVKMTCGTFPFATVTGYVSWQLTVWPGGGYVIGDATATSTACYNAYAQEYRR